MYSFMLIPLIWVVIFKYIPMYGVIIAFKDFSVRNGYMNSPFVGLKHFKAFFVSNMFSTLIKNTITLSIYTMVMNMICPIMLALMINEVDSRRFKKTFQMISYMPHFISTVIVVSMLQRIFSTSGIVNNIFKNLGYEPVSFLSVPKYFPHFYVWSGVWTGVGYGTVIYIAALAKVDTELYEAAKIDGASRLQKIRYIDFYALVPTITILMILNMGGIMNVGFEKVYLLQNNLNLGVSETISTYVYKVGLISTQYSFSSAVDFFNSIVNVILIVCVNEIARKVNDTSLW